MIFPQAQRPPVREIWAGGHGRDGGVLASRSRASTGFGALSNLGLLIRLTKSFAASSLSKLSRGQTKQQADANSHAFLLVPDCAVTSKREPRPATVGARRLTTVTFAREMHVQPSTIMDHGSGVSTLATLSFFG
jgi:hypothetical protein